MNLLGHPDRRSTSHSMGVSTVSNALERSIKHICSSRFCSLDFSMACQATNIMFDIELFCLKPHCVSGMRSSKTSLINHLRRIFAFSFPATERSEITLLFSHSVLSPFFVDQYYNSLTSPWVQPRGHKHSFF